MRKVLITGSSRGLGKSLAKELTARDFDVIASARNIGDIKDLDLFKKIALDVTDEEQIRNAVQESGGIDILVNNAAYTVAGPVEVIPLEEIRKEYEINANRNGRIPCCSRTLIGDFRRDAMAGLYGLICRIN